MSAEVFGHSALMANPEHINEAKAQIRHAVRSLGEKALATESNQKAIATLAKHAFDAYNAQGPNPGKTFDGRDVPPFDQTSDQVRAKWGAAVLAIVLP